MKTKPGTAPATDSRRLSDVARHVIAPAGIKSTAWPAVKETCRRLGWGFDPWQDGAGRLILSKRADGSYAADTIVISIPRQVGKTYLIGCIIFAMCLLEPGLTVIWTAHRKATAGETFAQFDGMAEKPKVKGHVRQVLRGKGDEKIIFNNGSRILFGARESGFGRGFTDVDILVFDEAQIMTEATLEDMAAAQNVAKNPLTFMMGTPPRPKDPGEMFALMRQEALDGESDSTLYIETSAERGSDPMNRDQWRLANPSFPHRTTERAMLRLRKKLKSEESWAREALGIWDQVTKMFSPIDAFAWREGVDMGPLDDTERPVAFGVDASHDRQFSVGAAWLVDDQVHVEEVWAGPSEADCLAWLDAAAPVRTPILIDALSPAASLIPALRARRKKVNQTSSADMAKGCGLFAADVKDGIVTHGDQDALNQAVKDVRKRAIGGAGGWGYDRRDPASLIHPAVAVTLARLGATFKRPTRADSAETTVRPTRSRARSGTRRSRRAVTR